ncbi:hypothetical protein ILUMI_27325 [Ignelater luminosus]|uniref:CHK kinase-like domain-containing protein n=1 Tax=Ignelater luminosus TaxID=2038154 RepID=A0A8K0FXU8_IGNLU|nr:hypothetical protein ILUMI_27325 [Ignelater luminosus]
MVQLADNNGIKELDKLLQKFLGEDKKIVKVETKRLTSAGENYGSQILAVEVHLQNKEILHLVAKMIPPNEWLKELFHTPISFRKETEFYNTIIPAMKEFQIQQGVSNVIDCFPECYGARVSLYSNVVDDDAVILLENLKLSAFQVANRMEGFDLETTKLLLQDMALLHAVPIAIKLSNPEEFNKKFLPYLEKNRKFNGLSKSAEKAIIDSIVKTIRTKQELLPFMSNIEKSLKISMSNIQNQTNSREPFATLNHNDYWVNNTMIKFENGKIAKNKIVDFQLIDYGSPGNDIIFFLFSSVQTKVIDEHYDDLIKLYYNKFISTLKELKCDTTMFTFKQLEEEINISAKSTQFVHILIMLKHILAGEGTVRELSEMTEEDMVSEAQFSDEYRKKVPEVALEFVKRNWIYT